MRISRLAILSSLLLLAACETTTQTTSGRDWLAASPKPKTVDLSPGNIDAAVRDAANVEPTLRFPARIGIARVDRGMLSPIPATDAKAWADAAARLGDAYGEFVPISPVVAAMFGSDIAMYNSRDDSTPYYYVDRTKEVVDNIRLASARQHLDAVLVYETSSSAKAQSGAFSFAKWTLIGAAVLPTEKVEAQATAEATLIDVRNGYPYGTVQADKDGDTSAARFETGDAGDALRDRVRTAAVSDLASQTERMMRKLRHELAALDRKPAP
ncbi:MAG: hypothetical protein ABSD74_10545 [Rhizomicrobium sp.]